MTTAGRTAANTARLGRPIFRSFHRRRTTDHTEPAGLPNHDRSGGDSRPAARDWAQPVLLSYEPGAAKPGRPDGPVVPVGRVCPGVSGGRAGRAGQGGRPAG